MHQRSTHKVNRVHEGILALSVVGVLFGAQRLVAGNPVPTVLFIGVALYGLTALVARTAVPHKYKLNVLLWLGSLTVGLYAADALIYRFPPPQRPTFSALRLETAKALGLQPDDRTPVEVLDSLRSLGIEVTRYANGRLVRRTKSATIALDSMALLPLSGVSLSRTVYCNEVSGWIEYVSDQYGYRNPPAAWTEPVYAMLIGDSFVHGVCVADSATVAARLREWYPRTVSVAGAGQGPLSNLATVVEYAVPLEPRHVLWFFFEGNDLTDLDREWTFRVLRNYLLDSQYNQNLFGRQVESDAQLRDAIEREAEVARTHEERASTGPARHPFWTVVTLGHLRNRLARRARPNTAEPTSCCNYQTTLREILSRANSIVRSWDGSLTFVFLPAYPDSGGSTGASPVVRDSVLAIVHGLGIPIVRLDSVFEAHRPDDLWYHRYSHLTPYGYAIVAKTIADHLDRYSED